MSDIPYPGLRPFKREESDIFFGREEHTDQLLEKLVQTRFLSVVGLSGCGKSSLVRAGMIAALETGYLSPAGAQWRVAAMRPGNHPLHNLAEALLTDSALDLTSRHSELTPHPPLLQREGEQNLPSSTSPLLSGEGPGERFFSPRPVGEGLGVRMREVENLTSFMTSHGPLGLVEVLRKTPFPDRTNFLLLVDQFEEIFRYHRQGNRNEAEAFVALLLTSAEQRELPVPIYVVTTMRSDFIGDCAFFRGLPEMMNRGQLLVPRLTREQQRMAMIGPARVFGGNIEPRLVNRLLDEMGTDPDQLPILQHCLMRMWILASPHPGPLPTGEGTESPFPFFGEEGQGEEITLTLDDYEAIGGLNNALPKHADEAFAELDGKGQHIAEIMFRCLSERGVNQRDTRRPVEVSNIASVAEVSASEVIEVVEVFRHPERCFLTPAAGVPLDPDSVLDIGHESLIRQWHRMNTWVEQEAQSAEIYRRLEQTAYLWKQGQAALWSTPDLENALAWKEHEKPTAVWASRYSLPTSDPPSIGSGQASQEGKPTPAPSQEGNWGFDVAMEFLEASAQAQEEKRVEEKREHQRELRRVRRQLGIAAVALIVLVVALAGVFRLWRKATEAEAEANKQTQFAVEARRHAERQARIAQARHLTAEAQNTLEEYPQRSLLLAIEALNVTLREGESRVPAAEEMLRQGLANVGGRGLSGHEAEIRTVVVSPNNRWLVTGSADGTARLWDLTAPNPTVTSIVLPDYEGNSELMISSDSRWLVFISQDRTARLWDLTADTPAAIVLYGQEAGDIVEAAISPDSHWLMTGSMDGTLRLWDLTAPDPAAAPVVLQGHKGRIRKMAISPDNRWLVTVGERGWLMDMGLWDLTAADPSTTVFLRAHEQDITSLTFSPDSHWLTTVSKDAAIRLWDLTAAGPETEPVILRGHKEGIYEVMISPDNRWLITGSVDATVRLWNLTAPDPEANPLVLQGHAEGISVVALSSDGRWLVTGSRDDTVRIWELTSDDPAMTELILRGHEDDIVDLAISPDNRWLVTSSMDKTVRLWDLTSNHPAMTAIVLSGHEDDILDLTISPDSRWLVTGSRDTTARLWGLTSEDPAATAVILREPEGDILDVAMSPNGRWLVTDRVDETILKSIPGVRSTLSRQQQVWDLTSDDPATTAMALRRAEEGLGEAAISLDGRWLVTASLDGTTRMWDLTADNLAAKTIILRGYEGGIRSVAVSPDGHWLVTGSWDQTARLWDVTSDDPAATTIVLRGHEKGVYEMAISPDGHWLVTSSVDNVVRLWDLTAPDPAAASVGLHGHEQEITSVVISADSRWLVTGSGDATARLWDLTAADPAATSIVLRGHEWKITIVAISVDNHWLITGSEDRTARLWDLTVPDVTTASPVILRGHEREISSVAISPDNHWLVTGSVDATARLWDLTAADPAAAPVILRGHEEGIYEVAISADSRWLVTGSWDGTARLWRLRFDELIALACRTAGRNFSHAEWDQYFRGEQYRISCPDLPVHSGEE